MSEVKYTLSASRTQDFLDCPYKYFLPKVAKIVPEGDKDVFRIGSNWQSMMEIITKSDAEGDKLFELVTESLNVAYRHVPDHLTETEWTVERNVLYYAIYAYLQQELPPVKLMDAEIKFRLPILNPDTGEEVEDAILIGAIDNLCRDKNGLFLGENKSTVNDIDIGSPYWKGITVSLQPRTYIYAAQRLQESGELLKYGLKPKDRLINRVVYNAWCKPGIKPKNLTQKDTAEFLETGEYYGAKFEVSTIAEITERKGAIMIDDEFTDIIPGKKEGTWAILESPGMYGLRLCHEMSEAPDAYFGTHTETHTDRDVKKFEQDLFKIYQQIKFSTENENFVQNKAQCRAKGKAACDFCPICDHDLPLDPVPAGFKCTKTGGLS